MRERLTKEKKKRAIKKGIKQVIFDRGGYLYHGNVAAIADGIRESGIEV